MIVGLWLYSCWMKTEVFRISKMIKYTCCCSAAKSCLALCNPMNYSTLGFPALHYLLEFVQTHIHWVSDAIQRSHLLPPPSLFAFYFSQHQGLFQMSRLFTSMARVLELQLQHQSFRWPFRTDFLSDWLVWFPCRSGDSQESSPAPLFKSINSLALSLLYGPNLISLHDYWKNHSFN